jgi:hypothetical protein
MPLIRHHGFHPRVGADPGRLNAALLVYALWDGTAVKVGKCSGHPHERLKDLQTGNPRVLVLLAYTTHLGEKAAHRRLGRWHLRGEWFRPAAGVLAELGNWDWVDGPRLAALVRDVNECENRDTARPAIRQGPGTLSSEGDAPMSERRYEQKGTADFQLPADRVNKGPQVAGSSGLGAVPAGATDPMDRLPAAMRKLDASRLARQCNGGGNLKGVRR